MESVSKWQPFQSNPSSESLLGVLRLICRSGLVPVGLASNRPRFKKLRLWVVGCGKQRFPTACNPQLQPEQGAVAQLGERLICTQEVAGSIPTSSTRFVVAWASGLRNQSGPVAQLARAHP